MNATPVASIHDLPTVRDTKKDGWLGEMLNASIGIIPMRIISRRQPQTQALFTASHFNVIFIFLPALLRASIYFLL